MKHLKVMLSEKTSSNFPHIILSVYKAMTLYPSMVLDWAVGYETCKFAQYKANYICGGNTTCSDPKNGSGYRCNCKKGYRGDPYLKDRCQGIHFTHL